MQKRLGILISSTLILASLACRLPFFRQAQDTPASVSDQPTENAVFHPTHTGMPTEEPTSLSTEPELTPAPTQGTKVFSEDKISITLPSTFVLGDAEKDLATLVEGLQMLSGEDAEDIEQLYENNKDDIILWAYDLNSPSSHQTSLLVMKNEEFAGMSLPIVMTFANVLLGDEVNLVQQEMLLLGGRQTARFLTTVQAINLATAQAVYLFNDAEKLWLIGFFTTQNEIDQRLATFDAAVASFKALEEL